MRTIVLVFEGGTKRSFVPVEGRDEREEVLRQLALGKGKRLLRVEELRYTPEGPYPFTRTERQDLLALALGSHETA